MDGCVEGAMCATSESSNINGKIFFHWFQKFVQFLPALRPQLLLLDGHFAHIHQDTVEFAMANDIVLYVLPPHTSHFLQPLDVGVYGPFKSLYEKALHQYPLHNNGVVPMKDNLVAITKIPFLEAFSDKNILSGFKKTGIFPLCHKAMMESIVGEGPQADTKTLAHHSALICSE